MSKTFCSECGNEIIEASKFCPSCGHPVGASATQPQQQLQPEQQHPQQTPPPEDPSHGVKPNNNFMILVIIAGIIGIGLFVYFWQQDAPEDVAEDFFSSIMDFNLKEAEKLISKDADPSVKEEISELSDSLDEMPIELSGQMNFKRSFKVLDVDKSGKKATVHAEISIMNDDFTEEAYFELQKEKGKWKILYVE